MNNLLYNKVYSQPTFANFKRIGILLTREKGEVMIKYAMYNVDSNLFVTEYQLYLPNREELKKRVENILNK